jgi:SAM-dependent methyltransferase
LSRDVTDAYDRWAASYDSDRNRTRDLDGRVLREAGLPVAGARVLELGCGTGRNTTWLADHAAHVVALDGSEGMLARAREALAERPVTFVHQDLLAPWPVAEGSVDLVLVDLVLEHVEALAGVFSAAAGALRPGGVLHVCELHPYAQLAGRGANFTTAAGEVRVPVFLHHVSDYVNPAIAAGFHLRRLGEWWVDEAEPAPRLLSLWFQR